MSCSSSRNATHSQPPNSPSSPDLPHSTEFAALAEKLQEALQSLLVFCRPSPQTEGEGVGGQNAAGACAKPEPAAYETRCYQLPDHILAEEREMLKLYGAENWQELVAKAHDQIHATVMLLEHISPHDELDGFSLYLIAQHMKMPLHMLGRLCSVLGCVSTKLKHQQLKQIPGSHETGSQAYRNE